MRVGIITFHRAYNCGAMLQAWALKTVIERMGHEVEFPILNHIGERRRWSIGWRNWPINPIGLAKSLWGCLIYNIASIPGEDLLRIRFKRFKKQNLPERKCEVCELERFYDALVVGSDQVWCSEHTGGYAPLFFGETLPKGMKKIAYAVSYGDKKISMDRLRRVAQAVGNFECVSARENIVPEQLADLVEKKVQVVLDPTLLLRQSDYQRFVRKSREPYLFMYTLDTNEFFVESAKRLAKKLNVRAIIVPMYQQSRYGAVEGLTYGISPDRLISYIANAEYVVSHSFHGTALSILFSKPFLSMRLEKESPGYGSRVGTLLKLTNSQERLVTPDISLDEMLARLKAPLKINAIELEKCRVASLEWIEKALR